MTSKMRGPITELQLPWGPRKNDKGSVLLKTRGLSTDSRSPLCSWHNTAHCGYFSWLMDLAYKKSWSPSLIFYLFQGTLYLSVSKLLSQLPRETQYRSRVTFPPGAWSVLSHCLRNALVAPIGMRYAWLGSRVRMKLHHEPLALGSISN